jgi:hypothetical protein
MGWSRGVCPVCRFAWAITMKGRLIRHGAPRCHGSGELAVVSQAPDSQPVAPSAGEQETPARSPLTPPEGWPLKKSANTFRVANRWLWVSLACSAIGWFLVWLQ